MVYQNVGFRANVVVDGRVMRDTVSNLFKTGTQDAYVAPPATDT